MDLVVRSVLAHKEELKRLEEETNRQYKDIMDPSQLTELASLASEMTKTLKTFVPDGSIDLAWMPLENIFLQRAFILTMLQHLAKIFLQLANGKTPGVAEKTQIIYGTHSPLFVGIDRIEQEKIDQNYVIENLTELI